MHTPSQTLTQQLHTHQSTLDIISDKLHPLLAVLNPDETPNLDELVRQVETNRKSLKQIDINLSDINIGASRDNLRLNSPEPEIPRSMTVSEGVKWNTPGHGRSFSDVGVNEQIKQLQGNSEPKTSPRVQGQDDGQYAEIGSLRMQILNRQLSGGISPKPAGGEGQRSNMFDRMELPSPLVEFDHVSSTNRMSMYSTVCTAYTSTHNM